MNLVETYNSILENDIDSDIKNQIDELLKNGVSICGFTFKIFIKNDSNISVLKPIDKMIIIHIDSKNIYDKKTFEDINNTINRLKIKYLKQYVIVPTVEKYITILDISRKLNKINVIPVIKNNIKILAGCKIYEDDSFTLDFSTRLTEYLKPLVEYIVIHELCHAKLGNKNGVHTEEFWTLLKKHSPHYKDFALMLNAKSDFID